MDPQELCSIPSRSISSPFLLIQFSKPCCPSLLPLPAHHSLSSSPFPLDSSQPFSPIYSHWVSTSWATWTCSVDRCPCVQQPALLHAQSPRLLCCFTGILHPKGHQCSTTIWKWTWWRQPGGQLSTNIYQAFSQAHNLARWRCFVSKTVNFHSAGKRHAQLQGVSTGNFWLGTSQPAIAHFSAQANQCPGLCSLN